MQGLRLRKLCNAFVPNVAPSEFVSGAPLRAVTRFSKKRGGLWVGGTVTASSQELCFVPNAMNVALHVGLEQVRIPMADVRAVRREFGWLTGIVVVEHRSGEFRFRCFGASGVAKTLASHVRVP